MLSILHSTRGGGGVGRDGGGGWTPFFPKHMMVYAGSCGGAGVVSRGDAGAELRQGHIRVFFFVSLTFLGESHAVASESVKMVLPACVSLGWSHAEERQPSDASLSKRVPAG